MEWYENLGFEHSPFVTDVFGYDYPIVGFDSQIDDIIYFVDSENMCVVKGKKGSGKSMLVKEVINHFGGNGDIIYIDANKISKRYNLDEKLLKKDMVLIMDNVNALSRRNSEKIKNAYDEGRLKSVIFITSSEFDFSDSLLARIGKNVVMIPDLNNDEILAIINERLDGETILNSELIDEIINNSNSIKEILMKCEYVCKMIIQNGEFKVNDVKGIELNEVTEECSMLCNSCGGPLENIGIKWLCPGCDHYCPKCGAILNINDQDCFECKNEVNSVNGVKNE